MRGNKQNYTNQNKDISAESDPYEKLDEHMRVAVDMRLENIGLKDIAAKIDVAYITARAYFMKGGACYEAYQHMKRLRMIERKRRLKRINKEIQDLAADAVVVLKELVRNPKTPAIVRSNSAAKILEMAGFGGVIKTKDVNESEGLKLLKKLMGDDEHKIKNHRDRKSLSSK